MRKRKVTPEWEDDTEIRDDAYRAIERWAALPESGEDAAAGIPVPQVPQPGSRAWRRGRRRGGAWRMMRGALAAIVLLAVAGAGAWPLFVRYLPGLSGRKDSARRSGELLGAGSMFVDDGRSFVATLDPEIDPADPERSLEGPGLLLLDNTESWIALSAGSVAVARPPRGIELIRGEIWTHVRTGGGGFSVSTAVAEVRVTGTSFGVSHVEDALSVRVTEGSVSAEFRDGRIVNVAAGQILSAAGTDPESVTADDSPPPAWAEDLSRDHANPSVR